MTDRTLWGPGNPDWAPGPEPLLENFALRAQLKIDDVLDAVTKQTLKDPLGQRTIKSLERTVGMAAADIGYGTLSQFRRVVRMAEWEQSVTPR